MAETVPGYYVWEAPGKAVKVHLNLEMIDRLSGVVLTGFGAIPRRGAEVGGILVGSINGDVVKIDEFEAVPCSYKRGPSYLLSEADATAFDEAWEKWKPEPGKEQYAVGYYRSNTRDLTTVADEDRELCDKYFPPPNNVMLFVRPYASKVSTAGFITYVDGKLEDATALEFPFRRYEIEGVAPPPRRALGEPRPDAPPRSEPRPGPAPVRQIEESPRFTPPDPGPPMYAPPEMAYDRPYPPVTDARARSRGWAWIPLSFIFLLLGVFLGFQMALTIYPKSSAPKLAPGEDPFSLGLSAAKADSNLHIKWERQSLAVRTSSRGVLFIKDGELSRQVDLDTSQLQGGDVFYRKVSENVQFRLEVYPRDGVMVSQTIEWKP